MQNENKRKKKHKKHLKAKSKRSPVGAAPGYYNVEEAKTPIIRLFSFDSLNCFEKKVSSLDELFKILAENLHLKHWIDIEGIGDNYFLQTLQKYFHLHNLEIEDIVSLHQRPKVETYGNHSFLTSRMLYYSENKELIDEQVCFFIFENILLTIQEDREDCLDPVRERLRKGKGIIREESIFYIAYAIMDTIVDHYFPMLEDIEVRLENIEEVIINKPTQAILTEILGIKKELLHLKKCMWAEREKFNELNNSFSEDDKLKIFLRDIYEHCFQVMEILEAHKETSYSLMEVYMSSMNNRMSEVMKVLTVISSIFIPLTFIVGVYGMNFSYIDEKGKKMPLNMPELYQPYGYVTILVIMLGIAITQYIYFKRKGWF